MSMNLSERLKAARDGAGLTQEAAAQKSGLDNSTISKFERGESEPRFSQLSALAAVYRVGMDYFFSEMPPVVQRVLWREEPADNAEIQVRFLELCRWYHLLEVWTNQSSEKKLPDLDAAIPGDLTYPMVRELAETTRHTLNLGGRPGLNLHPILEEVYGVKIFALDLGESGSAACVYSCEFGQAILLNKRSCRWRRNFDIAHELFHLLTWRRFKHDEDMCSFHTPRIEEEKFATCFAGNLLLPKDAICTSMEKAAADKKQITFSQLDQIAREFDVSLEALLWRMHFIFHWDEGKTKAYVEQAKTYLINVHRDPGPEPPTYPERYRMLAIQALRHGEISLGRFAEYLGISRQKAQDYLEEGGTDDVEVSISVA